MGNLRNVKVYDVSGRRLELDNSPHFVILIGENENGKIICEYGILDNTEFRKSDVTYMIESFSEFPEIDKNLQKKGCLFFCAVKKEDPDNTFSPFPMLVKYILEKKGKRDDEISIACALKMPESGELKVELLQVKLSNINEAGFKIGESFYRVGVMEK